MLKVFISTTLGPFVGAKIVLDSTFADAFIVAIFSGLIMTGLQFANALNRYERELANGR